MPDTLSPLWYALIPLPPLAAALWIGLGIALRADPGEAAERPTARLAGTAAAISLIAVLTVDLLALFQVPPGQVRLGTWLASGGLEVPLSLTLDPLGLLLATLVAVICLATLRFSVPYMHREPGFRRFFLVLSLFTGAMLLIVTAGNAVLTFVGWELAGISSYLLIGFVQERPQATENATRAFVTNRIGDAGFLLAIFLSFAWLGAVEWSEVAARANQLESLEAGLVLLGFLLAAFAKSALLPFSAWIGRALEGPTPSSAVFYGSLMVHAGVYLLIRCEPLLAAAPALMPLVALTGLATALYGWLVGLTQADVKSGLMFSTTAQIGLMVLWCGLGWFDLATAHLVLHALWRAYQFLHAPALMHWMDGPVRPLGGWLARRRLLFTAALQRFWLDPISDWLLVRPTRQLAADVRAFDERVLKPLVGLPPDDGALTGGAMSAGQASRAGAATDLIQGVGLLGGLMAWVADRLHWFEERLVLQGGGGRLGGLLAGLVGVVSRAEDLLERPRYLLLLIMATFVVIL
ncbi:MAG: NADH-quinone oxidoreductase subunit L [Bdellovibrio bacteriovorus]